MITIDTSALLLIDNTVVSSEPENVLLAGPPLALLDVAGQSAFERTVENLRQAGIKQITAVIEADRGSPMASLPRRVDYRRASPEQFWRAGEGIFHELAHGGSEQVLIIRLGAYAEVDFAQMLRFHAGHSARVTRAAHPSAPEVFCVSASRRNDAASLFRSGLSRCRSEYLDFPAEGYVNPVADARDLRQFAVDILTLKTRTQPTARQVRPGVWICPEAAIEDGARIVAPAFIGASARIRADALITRCSAIERYAEIDCGTVIENSTVLPRVYVGAGLELAHSVAGLGQIANLRRGTTTAITDPALLDQSVSPKVLAGRLWSLVPRSLRQRLSKGREASPKPASRPATLPRRESPGAPIPVHEEKTTAEFPSPLVVARRYGDQ